MNTNRGQIVQSKLDELTNEVFFPHGHLIKRNHDTVHAWQAGEGSKKVLPKLIESNASQVAVFVQKLFSLDCNERL